MNGWPRPEEALAKLLRGMADSIRSLSNAQGSMKDQIADLQARVTVLENNEEGEP